MTSCPACQSSSPRCSGCTAEVPSTSRFFCSRRDKQASSSRPEYSRLNTNTRLLIGLVGGGSTGIPLLVIQPKHTDVGAVSLPPPSCARDMSDCVKRLQSRRSRVRRLTCFHWCRRRCFPPHTAPVLGKHAEPVEQSAPGHRKQLHFYTWPTSQQEKTPDVRTGRGGGGGWEYLRLDRHLLGGARRLDRHAGLKRDCGGGVSACFRGLHGA